MATKKKPARVAVPQRYPSEITEEDCEAASRILSMDYWNDVRSAAQSIAQRLKENDGVDPNDPNSVIHEVVEGTQRVIYTNQAKQGLLFTNNLDAYEDMGMDFSGGIDWSAMMYAAMEQDVVGNLTAHGVDLDDPDSWPDIDLKEFD